MHTSPEVLAGLVFDDRIGSTGDHDHLARCPECRAELEQLTQTLRLAQEVTPDDLRRPSGHVWDRIRAELSAVLGDPDHAADAWRQVRVPAGFGSAVELARAHLSALPAWSGADGTAVVESDARHRRLRVRAALGPVEPHPSTETQVAVWLLAPDQSSMVRLGQVHGVHDIDLAFELPASVDLLRYPVVDLSRQPGDDDGTLAHSGDSIVRGVLA